MSDHRQPDERNEGETLEEVGGKVVPMEVCQGADVEAAMEPPTSLIRLDSRGRIIPPTAAERKIISERIRSAMEEFKQIPDDSDEDDADFFRAMDSLRPDNPLFEGLY